MPLLPTNTSIADHTPAIGDSVSVTFEYSRTNSVTLAGTILGIQEDYSRTKTFYYVLFAGDKHALRIDNLNVVKFWR